MRKREEMSKRSNSTAAAFFILSLPSAHLGRPRRRHGVHDRALRRSRRRERDRERRGKRVRVRALLLRERDGEHSSFRKRKRKVNSTPLTSLSLSEKEASTRLSSARSP